MKSYNKITLEILCERPISFIPTLGRIAKNANAGLFLSQLLFWWDKGARKGWVYKTIAEAQEETCLTKTEQNTAIRIWAGLGVLEKRRFGVPPKRHFKIHIDKLFLLLREYQSDGNGKLNGCFERNITENTT